MEKDFWDRERGAAGEKVTEWNEHGELIGQRDDIVGWYHQLNAHRFQWTPGVGILGSLCATVHGVDTTGAD